MKRILSIVPFCLALMAPDHALAFDGDGALVPYAPFDRLDTTEWLHQYQGVYVELLLPDSWLPEAGGLTDEQRRIVIDHFDMAYGYYFELIGRYPVFSDRPNIGKLRIGVTDVEYLNSLGVGHMGLQELEIDYTMLEEFKTNLEDGFELDRRIMVHELGHCFDVFRGLLSYDSSCAEGLQMCHAWTDFFDGYLPYYGRARAVRETFPAFAGDRTADGHEAAWINRTYAPYYTQISEEDVDWDKCVRTEGCTDEDPMITARDTWAGIMHRWAELYGVEAVQRGFRWLHAYELGNPTPVHSAEEDERRRILMMAAGADENISCFLDEWKWYAPQALRDELADEYGSAVSPKCLDFDLDGYSPLQGDCSDSNASIHPGATEVANGLDDDCNRYVDDLTPPPPPVLPLGHWGETLVPVKDGVDYVLGSSVLSLDETLVNDTPVWIRYWVTGVGNAGVEPYAEEVSLRWTPPAGLPAGTYGYRAQLVTTDKPVSDWTALTWFEYGGPCIGDSDCNDGDDCSVDTCTANGLCSNTFLEDSLYEAAGDMSHSTGNAYGEHGWNIYGNGYAQFTHPFAAGWHEMTVTAAGQYANSSWPNMRITVGGSNVFEKLVDSSSWKDYTFWVNRTSAGDADVRVNFTNDYYYDPPGSPPPIDRNLLLDEVTMLAQCGPAAPTTDLTLGPVNTETRYTAYGTQGLILNQLTFSGWTPKRIVVGFGQTDGVSMSGISVSVNGGTATNLTGDWQTITIPYTGQSSINLTVNSSTPRGLRTQWWAEG